MTEVFISHRGTDISPARQLKSDLLAHGYTVWLDQDELRAGDSIINRINEGLESASAVIVLYSDAGPGAWMDREWMSVLARVLNGHKVRLIPARIGKSTGPVIMADVKYADLRDWPAGVLEILEALG